MCRYCQNCWGLLHEASCGVQVALAHADRLILAGLQPSSIGIITPYNAQVRLRLGRLNCSHAAHYWNLPE